LKLVKKRAYLIPPAVTAKGLTSMTSAARMNGDASGAGSEVLEEFQCRRKLNTDPGVATEF